MVDIVSVTICGIGNSKGGKMGHYPYRKKYDNYIYGGRHSSSTRSGVHSRSPNETAQLRSELSQTKQQLTASQRTVRNLQRNASGCILPVLLLITLLISATVYKIKY